MICKKCGKKLDEETLYCPYCGTNVGYIKSQHEKFIAEKTNKILNDNVDFSHSSNINKKPPKKKKGLLATVIILVFTAVIGVAFIFTYKYFNPVTEQKSILQQSMELQKQAGHYSHPTQAPAQAPVLNDTSASSPPVLTESPKPSADSKLQNSSSGEYDTYENSMYGLVCDVPSHMTIYDDHSSECLLSVHDDSTSVRICYKENIYGQDAQDVYDSFIQNSGGVIEYDNINNNSFTYRTTGKNSSTYCHATLQNDSIYWFEVSFDNEYEDKVEEYIDHIYNSFKIN